MNAAERESLGALGRRHGFGDEATAAAAAAVAAGNGRMAQFDHPEFGGAGQWLRGGMTMLSGPFDAALKSRVAALCEDLATALESDPRAFGSARPGERAEGAAAGREWWPVELGRPSASGSQNGERYAYFAAARRLAIERAGRITVYDTQDREIRGAVQRQAASGSLAFSTRDGSVDVGALPIVSNEPLDSSKARAPEAELRAAVAREAQDPIGDIERLAELRRRGILSESEFEAKKSELLGRV